MKKLIHRIKLYLTKKLSFHFLLELTAMDFGRWVFKKAYICNRCGSPNIYGYYYGLHCQDCINLFFKWDKEKKKKSSENGYNNNN